MPLLPRVLKPVLKLGINCQLPARHSFSVVGPIVAILFSLFTLTLASPTTIAAAPTPLPCQNAIYDESLLTDNWLVDENKNPPQGLLFTFGASGEPGTPIDVFGEKNFQVDFSQLSALFGPTNSNFNEGNYQDTAHRNANTSELNQEEINKYHGPIQKTEGRAVLDELRKKYVEYVKLHPNLAESAKTFSDANGNDPKTISDLIDAYGDNPQPTRSGDNNQTWQTGWGKYWDKIPTAYNEFYEGRIIFKIAEGQPRIQAAKDGTICPRDLNREITFVMPELFRTTAVTGQMNRTLVPKSAQSQESNNLILSQNTSEPKTVLGKIINTCLQALKNNPLSTSLKKIIKVSSKLFNPDNVYAANPPGCIKALTPGKEGQDPYCALPPGQLNERDGENCRDKEDSFKIAENPENPNVICNFKIHWRHQNSPLNIDSVGAGAWDSCEPHPTIPGYLRCQVQIAIWPVFRIPWTSQIWNNTLYADNTEPGTASQGDPALGPIKGRPGVYSFFTPQIIFEDKLDTLMRYCKPEIDSESQACDNLREFVDQLDLDSQAYPQESIAWVRCYVSTFFGSRDPLTCTETFLSNIEKRRPGETNQQSDEDPSRRFMGGTDCSKEFVRASLTDKGVHPQLGLDFGAGNTCNLLAANQRSDDNDHAPGKPPRGSPPDNVPPTQVNCFGRWILNNPVGNFGDPDCDFSEEKLYNLLKQQDSANADYWFYTIVPCEAPGYNVNAYNPHSGPNYDQQAFGLFQMGHAAWPQYGLDYQIADGQPNEYDRGDVIWQQQVPNAINYNSTYLNGDFRYWECSF